MEATTNNVTFQQNGVDGVDHININYDGATELGRKLSRYQEMHFVHPIFGSFNCMEGFWHWAKTHDKFVLVKLPSGRDKLVNLRDDLRVLVGKYAKAQSRKLERRTCRCFQSIIQEADYYRIIQNPELRQLFVESTLPFEYYYFQGPLKLKIYPKGHHWVSDGYEHLRQLIREDKTLEPVDYEGLI